MRRFGWTRLACLFLILTVLAALVRIGGGAEARSVAARVPDALVVASEGPESAVTRLTDEDLSVLEDMRGEPRPTGDRPSELPAVEPSVSEPSVSSEPDPGGASRRPAEAGARTVPTDGPPVFYRPAAPGAGAGSGPVCGDLSGVPRGGRIVFPLERQFFYSYEDTWGAPRTQGGHEGTDLMTPTGAPEYAITDGTVVPVAGSDADGWNTLGGNAVMIRADYSIGPVKAGDLFYYAHLERESTLETGDRVNAGQVVGYAGDTGQGPPGTSGLFPPHLHLGWYDGTGGREEASSGAMNPYPLLEWIKSNGGAVSGGSDARFCEAPRPGPPIPSSGADWPAPSNPGLTPDLDTGSNDPTPVRSSKGDRDKTSPAKQPPRPKEDRPDNPPKPPNEDRPQPQKPDRPEKTPQRPGSPSEDDQPSPRPSPPGDTPPNPTEPSTPPQNSGEPPSDDDGQYDPSTGEATEPPSPRPDREQEATPKPKPADNEDPTPKEKRP